MVRVLVVDDQRRFREAARMVLELSDGFELIGEAETGLASVKLAAELRPDLVLMDVNLPDIDGFEATQRIRASAGGDRPVVLMLSTYEAVDYAARALEAGASAFVSKSTFAPDELEAAWAKAQAGN